MADRPIQSSTNKEMTLQVSQLQSDMASLQQTVSELYTNFTTFITTPSTQPTPQSVNSLRNGALVHSVASWINLGAPDDSRYECYAFFSTPVSTGQPMYISDTSTGNATITFTSAAVNTGTDTINFGGLHGLATGTAIYFSTIGTLASPLVVATTYYAIALSTTTIQIATTIANALAGIPINLTTTGTGTSQLHFNYTLKQTTHALYVPLFSDWDWTTGTARFQGSNDISSLLAGANIDPSLSYYLGFNIVRASKYVTAGTDTRIAVGLYAYSTSKAAWDWIFGTFTASATVLGSVGTPTSRDYVIQAVTDRGFTVQSTPLTVASAPSDTDFAGGARVNLSWPQVLNYGIISYDIYRKTGTAYKLLKSVATGQLTYIDNNSGDTATGYPSYTFNELVAFTASRNNILAVIPYAGDPLNPTWATIPFAIRVPQNYNKSDTDMSKGQWLRMYLEGTFASNGCLDFTTSDGTINNGSSTLTSAAAQFTNGSAGSTNMVGLTITVTDTSGNILTTTIASYTSATQIGLTAPWTFPNTTTAIIYITGGAPPHSLWMNQIHLDYVEGGAFAPNAADVDGTHGIPPVLLNGTTQGGGGGGQGGSDGGPIGLGGSHQPKGL